MEEAEDDLLNKSTDQKRENESSELISDESGNSDFNSDEDSEYSK